MGETFLTLKQARGWRHAGGDRYDARLLRDLPGGGQIELTFAVGAGNRAIVSNRYALIPGDGNRRETDWEWADLWQGRLQYASKGCLWEQDPGGSTRQIADFTGMTYEERQAPYTGIQR
jgi:hypothetical protein